MPEPESSSRTVDRVLALVDDLVAEGLPADEIGRILIAAGTGLLHEGPLGDTVNQSVLETLARGVEFVRLRPRDPR